VLHNSLTDLCVGRVHVFVRIRPPLPDEANLVRTITPGEKPSTVVLENPKKVRPRLECMLCYIFTHCTDVCWILLLLLNRVTRKHTISMAYLMKPPHRLMFMQQLLNL
jgi:hypothetical protein